MDYLTDRFSCGSDIEHFLKTEYSQPRPSPQGAFDFPQNKNTAYKPPPPPRINKEHYSATPVTPKPSCPTAVEGNMFDIMNNQYFLLFVFLVFVALVLCVRYSYLTYSKVCSLKHLIKNMSAAARN